MIAVVAIVATLAVALVVIRVTATSGDHAVVRLVFPRTVSAEQAIAAVRSLAGLLPPWWRRVFGSPSVALELRATAEGIEHLLTMPAARADYVLGALRAAIPGLRVSDDDLLAPLDADLARELRVSGSGLLRTDAAAASNAGILAALHPLRAGEVAAVQYVIVPTGRLVWAWVSERFGADELADPSRESVEPDFAVAIRVGVATASAKRSRQLIARLLGPFHGVGTHDARLVRRALPSAVVAARQQRGDRPDFGAPALAADELAACLGLPLDAPTLPGLTLAGSRELPPIASVSRRGLVLGDSTVAGSRRAVAVTQAEARRGLHVCAPTGAGKSTVLTSLAVQLVNVKARPGLIVIDSKGDLIADLCDRIPAGRHDDVIVFDPADAAPVGFNLIGGGGETGLVVDHVVAELRSRYGAAGLGPRSEDLLRASLTTLTATPGHYTLCEVEPLLANASAFRQKLVGGLDEPVLESFWAWYASLSEAARAEAIAPLANKLRTYTLRRRVRAVVGQSGGLDLADALDGGKIVLISLAKGLIGQDAAALIGAAMTSRLWTAIQARAAIPARDRRPATVICDEFQDFAAVSPVFADAVSQSRGYGVGWVLAHQHLNQLDPTTRQAVLANCRSRLVMQTTAADAATFAREFAPHLDAADLQGLGAFEGFAAVSTGAAVAPPASIQTREAPPAMGTAEQVRARSRARHGRDPAEVDAAIRARIAGSRSSAPVGGARRRS